MSESQRGTTNYHLMGVINHCGTAYGGHYYSFIKVRDRWYCFDDSRVDEWTFESVMSFSNGHGSNDSEVYCLVYSASKIGG